VVTAVTAVPAPEAGRSEISVDIRTVTTMPLITIKCKGSLKAVWHSPDPERGYDGPGA
jgi:hypothetical protein